MSTSGSLIPTLKRWIVLAHLYLGVAFSALFVMWFVSGVVLVFSPYPAIPPAEVLRAAAPLDCARCVVTARDALRVADVEPEPRAIRTLRLGMLGTRPVWRVTDAARRVHAVYADTLARVPLVDAVTGAQIAMQFARAYDPTLPSSVTARFVGLQTEPDQWTLEAPIPAQLPLLRFELTDAAGTRLYAAQRGGEVVTGTTRRGRLFAWLGAIPHWIYPTVLRRHVASWSWLVIVLSAFGTIMSVTGVAVGLWQWRWRTTRPRDGRPLTRSPYRDWMMRWHHIAGLVFGTVTCTWIFSGLMSMNPGEWSPGTHPSALLRARWATSDAWKALLDVPPAAAWRALQHSGVSPHELHPAALANTPYWLGTARAGVGSLVSASSISGDTTSVADATIVDLASQASGARIADTVTLRTYDAYYRPAGHDVPPLPVLRVRLRDADATWLYVAPHTGQIRASFASRTRWERWVYTGLHDLDFAWLYQRHHLWQAVVVLLSIGGGVVSLTGLVIAWRWLRVMLGAPLRVRRR